MADLSPLDRGVRAARRGHHEAARRILDGVLEGEPENETALAWRARITDDAGARSVLLRRALAVNPDNQWAARALEDVGDIEGGAVASSGSLDDVGRRAASIEHLQCPNCGGQVEVHPGRGSKSAVCTHCGSVLDLTSKQLEILGRVRPSFKPARDILPGAEAVLEGERHLVTGWLRYKGWDDEESWTWDEWQLVSDSGQVRYLSFSSDEGFLLQTPIRPTPKVSRRGAEIEGKRVPFHEVSPAKISGMAGELTWRPQLDKTLQVAEGRRGGLHYSAELTADEVEVVGGPKLSELEVWKAFGRDDRVADLEAKKERARRRRRSARTYALIFLAGGAFFWVLGSWLVPKLDYTLAETSVSYTAEPVTLPPSYERTARALVEHDTVEVGRIALESDRAYRVDVTVTAPVSPPLGLDVDVAFVGPGGAPVYRPRTASLYGAEGAEVTATSKPFRIQEESYAGTSQAPADGEYRMVYLVRREWASDGTAPADALEWTEPASFPISATVRSVWLPGPFWFATVFSLFLSFAFFAFSRTGPR